MTVSMLFDMTLILLAGLLAGLAIWQIRASGIASRPGVIQDDGDRPVFLFDGDTLTDCTPAARRLIAGAPTGLADFDALVSVLGAPFPELRDRFERIEPGTEAELGSEDHPGLSLRLARHGDVTRLSLTRTDGAMQDFDDLAIRHRAEETAQLRRIVDQSAEPIWIEDAGGRLVWSNSAYLDLCDRVGERTGDRAWPTARVFENLRTPVGTAPLRDRRVLRLATDDAERWYCVTSHRTEDGILRFAARIDALVHAEREKDEFRQTLGKTFAQLSTGLAIFDRQRRLAIFNPALTAVTGLTAEFLSVRPTLDTVLDHLREQRRLPEPRDYANWRKRFLDLEQSARSGNYCETWNLADGQTLRVTARQNPDGAIAVLLEDVTSDVTMTRHMRLEMETSQAVLDMLEDPIAVLSVGGTLIMSNAAFRRTWGLGDDTRPEATNLAGLIATLKSACQPTGFWDRLAGGGGAEADTIVLRDGRMADCTAQRIHGGSLMLRMRMIQGTAKPRLVGTDAGRVQTAG